MGPTLFDFHFAYTDACGLLEYVCRTGYDVPYQPIRTVSAAGVPVVMSCDRVGRTGVSTPYEPCYLSESR